MNARPMILAAAALMTLPGCIIVATDHKDSDYPDSNLVTRHEMTNLVAGNRGLALGMSQGEALSCYPADLTTLKATGSDGTVPIEVWRVWAVQNNGGVSFTRWLYFYDGRLVELSDQRVDWHETDRLETWRAFVSGG